MTSTEAKALALVNEVRRQAHIPTTVYHEAKNLYGSCWEALCRVIEAQEATEARHAAEMQELKERFSEAVQTFVDQCGWGPACFLPFKTPAPDPLVEVLTDMECPDAASIGRELRAAMQARGYEWRKIGEAGE